MTQVTSAQANKVLQAALFVTSQRAMGLVNMLTEEAPQTAKVPNQTSHMAPVVRVTDLTKQAGDEVSMQIFHNLSGRPTMGDRNIAGRLEDLSQADFSLKINQTGHGVDAGGKMSQKRTKHDLRGTARTLLSDGYYPRLTDQRAMVLLAGARGDYVADDIIIPLDDDDEFDEMMINPVLPPTYERHYFGGDATSFEHIDSADIFGIGCVDNLALALSEMAHPIQPIRFSADKMANDPLYLLMVTPRQWNDFYVNSTEKDWKTMALAALERTKNFNHPVLLGESAMWRNILIKPYKGMPIRFNQGATTRACTVNSADGAYTTVTAHTTIDRGLLLGGQALANAFGAGTEGATFSMHEEKTNHGNNTELSIRWMSGLQKIRFKSRTGYLQDHGVIALDTAISK